MHHAYITTEAMITIQYEMPYTRIRCRKNANGLYGVRPAYSDFSPTILVCSISCLAA